MQNRKTYPHFEAIKAVEKALFDTLENKSLNSEAKVSRLREIVAAMKAMAEASEVYEKQTRAILTKINLPDESILPRPNINAKNSLGETALYAACKLNEPDCMRFLIEAKADVSAKIWIRTGHAMYETTAVRLAVSMSHETCFRILLEHTKSPEKDYLLVPAVSLKNSSFLKILLEAKANPDIKNNDGETLSIIAARLGDKESLSVLIAAQAKLDIQSTYAKKTALMEAALNGHVDCIHLLAKAKADLNLQDREGDTALILATKLQCGSSIQALIQANALLDMKNQVGNTALIEAATTGYALGTRLLLNAKANPNIQNEDGITALMRAVSSNKISIVKDLLDEGANLSLRTKTSNNTALHFALRKKDLSIIALLFDYGAIGTLYFSEINDVVSKLNTIDCANTTDKNYVNFCLGIASGRYSDAENHMRCAFPFAPALRHWGDWNAKEGRFFDAANYYMQALSQDDFFAPSKIVGLTQQLQLSEPEKKHEVEAENKKQENAVREEKDHALTVLQVALTRLTLSAHLSVEQWLYVAVQAISNPCYEQRDGIRFSLACANKAFSLAKTEGDTAEAKTTFLSSWSIFSHTNEVEIALDAAGIVADYCGETKLKPAVCEVVSCYLKLSSG